VFLGGLCAVHQFARIGHNAIIGGLAGVAFDVIPFTAVVGHRANLAGINRVGLKRRGFSSAQIQAIYKAYQELFFSAGSMDERVDKVAVQFADDPNVMSMVDFIRSGKSRRLMPPRRAGSRGESDD
jgi:UDP-N-acetylglucosamine acyltransferase